MFLRNKPKALVLRHVNRGPITRTLVSHHAAVDQTRVMVWRAKDNIVSRKKTGKQPSPTILAMLENSTVHPDKMPAVMYFYPGIPYRFTTNDFPLLGWVNNAECVGHSVILHANEPPDTGKGDFHVLKYPPIAIMVSIEGRDLSGLFKDPVPPNCIPVFPKHSDTFVVDWSKTSINIKLYEDRNDLESANKFSVRRTGFPLEVALAFTDFFAQGQSFKGAPHLLHLNIGKRESYKKANILVPVSRPATLSDLKLAHPLWSNDEERGRVIAKFATALKPCPDYLAEMERLRMLHEDTMSWMQNNTTFPTPLTGLNQQSMTNATTALPQSRDKSTPPVDVRRHRPTTPGIAPDHTSPSPLPRRLHYANDDDFVMGEYLPPIPDATTPCRATTLLCFGRHECAYGDTEALGDCGPLAILQTLFLSTSLSALRRNVQAAITSAAHWADARCADFRRSICDVIHQQQDLQHIFDIQYNRREDWRTMAYELGRCVAPRRCARYHQNRPGIWLNELGLRASARHLNVDIIVFSGKPRLPGFITLYPAAAGPHVDEHGRLYHSDSCYQIDCSHFLPASLFEDRTIVICLEDMHFRCTRPSSVHDGNQQAILNAARMAAIANGETIRTFRAVSEL